MKANLFPLKTFGLIFMLAVSSCVDTLPIPDPQPCQWLDRYSLNFTGRTVSMKFPSNFQFATLQMPNKFETFWHVFGYGSSPYIETSMEKLTSIKITSSTSACTGVVSQSKIYSDFHNDITPTVLQNQWRAKTISNSSIDHQFDIVVTAGPYRNNNNGLIGTLIWSNTYTQSDMFPNFEVTGAFKTVETKTVYIADRIKVLDSSIKLAVPAPSTEGVKLVK